MAFPISSMIHRNSVTFHHPETGVGLSMIWRAVALHELSKSSKSN